MNHKIGPTIQPMGRVQESRDVGPKRKRKTSFSTIVRSATSRAASDSTSWHSHVGPGGPFLDSHLRYTNLTRNVAKLARGFNV